MATTDSVSPVSQPTIHAPILTATSIALCDNVDVIMGARTAGLLAGLHNGHALVLKVPYFYSVSKK